MGCKAWENQSALECSSPEDVDSKITSVSSKIMETGSKILSYQHDFIFNQKDCALSSLDMGDKARARYMRLKML